VRRFSGRVENKKPHRAADRRSAGATRRGGRFRRLPRVIARWARGRAVSLRTDTSGDAPELRIRVRWRGPGLPRHPPRARGTARRDSPASSALGSAPGSARGGTRRGEPTTSGRGSRLRDRRGSRFRRPPPRGSADWPAGAPQARESRRRATRPGFSCAESLLRRLPPRDRAPARRASLTSNARSSPGSARSGGAPLLSDGCGSRQRRRGGRIRRLSAALSRDGPAGALGDREPQHRARRPGF